MIKFTGNFENKKSSPPTPLIEELVRGLLHVPGTGAQGHPGSSLLNPHVFQLPQHGVKLRVLKK